MIDHGRHDALHPVILPARKVPPPQTISPEARAFLSWGAANDLVHKTRPAVDDRAAWDRSITASIADNEPPMRDLLARTPARVEDVQIAGVTVYVATPTDFAVDGDSPVFLYGHGGAFIYGQGMFARAMAARQAAGLGCIVYAPDYRTAPANPFPAAPADCLAVYRELATRHDPRRIMLGGTSAGGNIAAATVLMILDAALPMPAALALLSPEADLTERGDSFRTNAGLDVILKRGLPEANALYANGHDLTDPYLSPLFADVSRFPPTLLQTGTRDLFLSNTVLLHRNLRRAGIMADLHVWEAMPHTGFGGDTLEDAEISVEVRAFMERHCRG